MNQINMPNTPEKVVVVNQNGKITKIVGASSVIIDKDGTIYVSAKNAPIRDENVDTLPGFKSRDSNPGIQDFLNYLTYPEIYNTFTFIYIFLLNLLNF